MAEKSSDPNREVVVEHVCKARAAAVFKAWTDPKHVALWWGPRGFSNPVCDWDARAGGEIRIHMQGPDGTIHPMIGVFREVVRPQRLVFTSSLLDKDGEPIFEVLHTVTLVGNGATTRVTVQSRVLHATAAADRYLPGMEQGWAQSLERLAESTQAA